MKIRKLKQKILVSNEDLERIMMAPEGWVLHTVTNVLKDENPLGLSRLPGKYVCVRKAAVMTGFRRDVSKSNGPESLYIGFGGSGMLTEDNEDVTVSQCKSWFVNVDTQEIVPVTDVIEEETDDEAQA